MFQPVDDLGLASLVRKPWPIRNPPTRWFAYWMADLRMNVTARLIMDNDNRSRYTPRSIHVFYSALKFLTDLYFLPPTPLRYPWNCIHPIFVPSIRASTVWRTRDVLAQLVWSIVADAGKAAAERKEKGTAIK